MRAGQQIANFSLSILTLENVKGVLLEFTDYPENTD